MGMRPQGNEQEARRNKHVRSAPSKIAVKALGEEVLDGILDKSPNPLLLILDCVQDPHNLGAILRTADGAGVDAVIAPRDKSVGITETVLRVSVGAAEKVPFIQVTNLARTMKQLQSRGIWIFGTSDKGDRGLYETDFTGPAALVMGAEGEGMRRLTEENCDFLLRIPMKGSIPCLNVSVATCGSVPDSMTVFLLPSSL
jgi:23S rRNA (guanosine2251-2'-O)-methyltransferase